MFSVAELFRLCKIAIAIPVSSAGCERSFSSLKLIKTYLRNRMSDNRLSNLRVLHIEKELSEAIDLDEFMEMLPVKHKNMKINFARSYFSLHVSVSISIWYCKQSPRRDIRLQERGG